MPRKDPGKLCWVIRRHDAIIMRVNSGDRNIRDDERNNFDGNGELDDNNNNDNIIFIIIIINKYVIIILVWTNGARVAAITMPETVRLTRHGYDDHKERKQYLGENSIII